MIFISAVLREKLGTAFYISGRSPGERALYRSPRGLLEIFLLEVSGMKRVLSVLLAVLLIAAALPMSAVASSSDFDIQNGSLVKYNGPGGDVVIPAGVTSIGNYAFSWNDNLTSVAIPNGVTTIGESAFRSCANLRGVSIPGSVTRIGMSAFFQCGALTGVTIPDSVTSIGMDAFEECASLTSIVIPNGVTGVGSWTFAKCASLVSVTLPDTLTNIGDGAFAECTSLRSIVIPSKVKRIGVEAFYGCTNLAAVTIQATVTGVADRGFAQCAGLTDVYYVGTKAQWEKNVMIFADNEALTSAAIHYNDGSNPTPAPTPDNKPTPTPVPNVGGFEDVKANDWFASHVEWAVENGITSGKGSKKTFKPNDTCSRVEIMTFIWASKGKPTISSTASFSDMPTLPAFRSAISWAVENDVTRGIGGGKFGTTAPCTRVQAVTFLWAAAGKPQPSAAATFSDMTGNQVFDTAISWAVENQITSGTGNNCFDPNKRCTRGEIVTFLHKAYQ